jgi:tetratricopeptide (TPR) repeat protein
MKHVIEEIKIAYKEGQYREAVFLIEKIQERGFTCPEILLWKGRSLQLLDEPSHSLSDIEDTFRQALDIDPDFVPAIVELAWFYLNVYDDADQAAKFFEMATSIQKELLTETVRGMTKALSEHQNKERALRYLSTISEQILGNQEIEDIKKEILSVP